ncbi:hypothetical protein FOG51_02424 [Hanseniaspora uvarum]|nr:hypothetical protein FOG51_02424 [Hanseniaspora uvarum]
MSSRNNRTQSANLPLNHPQLAAKLKVLLKTLLKRLALRLKEEEYQAKLSQREIANLLLSDENKEQKAYFKTEAMIMEDSTVQMLEILENLTEMVLVRIPILNNTIQNKEELREIPGGLNIGIGTLLYASLHFPEFKELIDFGDVMSLKFGRAYVDSILKFKLNQKQFAPYKDSENEEEVGTEEPYDVSKDIDSKFLQLSQRNIADTAKVEAYLVEIARAYNAPYSKLPKEKTIVEEAKPKETEHELSDLEKRFASLKTKK